MIFLIILAAIWIVAASISDVRKREVPNWLNFSLVAVALSYRVMKSLIEADASFLVQGLIGFAIFFALGYIFYYGKIFAGGDAKLLIALGPVLPFSSSFAINLSIFLVFVFLLLLAGSVYGLLYSFVLTFKFRKKFAKEFKVQFIKNKFAFIFALVVFIIILITASYFSEKFILFLGVLIFIFPFLYTYARSIEESCMVKKVKPSKLVEGDWLYKEVRIGINLIKPNWQGLTIRDLKILKKSRKSIYVKEGIPFVPAFLIAFIILVVAWFYYGGFFEVFGLF
ncbi:MAG: A24 family peptidase [archaeon]